MTARTHQPLTAAESTSPDTIPLDGYRRAIRRVLNLLAAAAEGNPEVLATDRLLAGRHPGPEYLRLVRQVVEAAPEALTDLLGGLVDDHLTSDAVTEWAAFLRTGEGAVPGRWRTE